MNQGTPEWLAARAGHATASRFSDILAKVKVGEAAGRQRYRWQLVTERLTGQPVEGYRNAAMERGQLLEPDARAAYEAQSGNLVAQVGFLSHKEWVGCSPDGLVDADGGIEIKCPDNPVIHVQTLHGGMPSEHVAQVQGAMWVTGRKWWDFVSYDPRMPEKLQLYIQHVTRDEAYIEKLDAEVAAFLAEVEKQHAWLVKAAA
jgi:putative phage-type endonuclease